MLTSNLGQSGLQARLSQVLGPYTELMQLDIAYIPYHLTHGSLLDADNRLQVVMNDGPHAGEVVTLPDVGLRGGLQRLRYQQLARLMSSLVETPNGDNNLALLSEGIGGRVLNSHGAESGELSVIRHLLVSMDAARNGSREQRDPDAPQYISNAYQAALRLFDGEVVVTKKSDVGEVAPVDGPVSGGAMRKTSAAGDAESNAGNRSAISPASDIHSANSPDANAPASDSPASTSPLNGTPTQP